MSLVTFKTGQSSGNQTVRIGAVLVPGEGGWVCLALVCMNVQTISEPGMGQMGAASQATC